MSLSFGTDGVRGVANVELTPELVMALGRAAARVLPGDRFLIGRDTRISGPLLSSALAAGLSSEGIDAVDLGVLPTPAVAHLSATEDVPAAVVSASHNPFADNGVKLFAAGGRKLADEVEERLEAELRAVLERARDTTEAKEGAAVGRISSRAAATASYEDHILASVEGRTLHGVTVAVDCANGACFDVAPRVLRSLGADVIVSHAEPDGVNINEGCGSTHPGNLQRLVVERGADVGLAFDGDADRVLAVAADGELVDGDQIMAVCALDLRDRGLLADDTVVVTVMTNLGFRLAMRDHGIHVVDTQVGDRYVLEALEEGHWALGGEQSGHVIFRRLATTGDGLLTGVQLLDAVRRRGRPLADLAAVMTRLPQVLRNVRVARRDGLEAATDVWDEVAAVEAELAGKGRVLLRPSGTEPLVRVMVEAATAEDADAAVTRLCDAVVRELG